MMSFESYLRVERETGDGDDETALPAPPRHQRATALPWKVRETSYATRVTILRHVYVIMPENCG
jgi:hypothetical protein